MEDRKQQLVGEALSAICRAGYDSFSYADLSEKTGITKASIHHHFPKKEDLGVAVLSALVGLLDRRRLELEKLAAHDALVAFLFKGVDLDDPVLQSICPITSMQAEANVIPTAMLPDLKEVACIELDIVQELLRRGKKDGDFKLTGGVEKVAQCLLAANKGGLIYARSFGSAWFAEMMHNTIDQFVVRQES